MSNPETDKPSELLRDLEEIAERVQPSTLSRIGWNLLAGIALVVVAFFLYKTLVLVPEKNARYPAPTVTPRPADPTSLDFVLLGLYDQKLYYHSGPTGQVLRRDPATGRSETMFDLSAYQAHLWSPGGSKIAIISTQDHDAGHIYVVDLGQSAPSLKLLTPRGDKITKAHILLASSLMAWSPDEEHIAFVAYDDRRGDIFVARTDGSEVRRITYNETDIGSVAWIDDDELAFVSVLNGQSKKFLVEIDNSSRYEWR